MPSGNQGRTSSLYRRNRYYTGQRRYYGPHQAAAYADLIRRRGGYKGPHQAAAYAELEKKRGKLKPHGAGYYTYYGRRRKGGGGYVTRKGDNLFSLAERFGVSPEDLARANHGLRSFRPGLSIRVPHRRVDYAPEATPDILGGVVSGLVDLLTPNAPAYTEQVTGGGVQQPAPVGGNIGPLPTRRPGAPPREEMPQWNDEPLMFQRQLMYTLNQVNSGVWAGLMNTAIAEGLGLTEQDMQEMGYVKEGDWWVALEALTPEESAPAGGGGGGGYGGYGGGGYGGWGGGGRRGGGFQLQKPGEQLPYTATETGAYNPSMTGRLFDPLSPGYIHWRL